MTSDTWIRVPVGVDSEGWTTRSSCRRVLLVVHNVTSATRLLDVLPLFRDDFRVQLLATCTGSSPFQSGVPQLLEETGVPVLPWEQAVQTPVDLAISASYGGELHRIQGKLVILSHGVGYNKRLTAPATGDRRPATGDRRPATGDRRPDADAVTEMDSKTDKAPVFGLSGEWLLHEGRPLADVTVLSHPEQLTRLSAACPPAAPTAVLAGDPCYDRLLAALPFRERYRRALGVGPDRRLVVLNSTWNPESLFGDGGGNGGAGDSGNDMLPSLLPRLMAELPADEYRVAAVLHPNIWHGHGPGQIRTWLDGAQRAGLTLVPPLEGWRQAVIAADLILGDQGSVSFYGAATGAPVLLCADPEDGLDPDSPVAEFVRAAPRLRPYERVEPQLDAVLRGHRRGHGPGRRAAERTSSAPGRSAALLRRSFYGLLGMPEPDAPALLTPLPLPPYEPDRRTAPVRVLTRLLGASAPEVEVTRHPAPVREPAGVGSAHDPVSEAHTSVSEDTTDPSRLALADVIVCHADEDDPRTGPPGAWTSEVLRRHLHCTLAVYVTGPDGCSARTRDGALFELAAERDRTGRRDLCDPAAYASALHAWLAGGRSAGDLTSAGLTVRTGRASHHVLVREPGEDPDDTP